MTISRDARFVELVAEAEQEKGSVTGAAAAPKEVSVSFKRSPAAVEDVSAEAEENLDCSEEYDSFSDGEVFEGFPAEEYLHRSARSTKGVPPYRLVEKINYVQSKTEKPRNLRGGGDTVKHET